MRSKCAVLAMAMLFICSACGYGPITGTVVDAETGKPVEGAVVLVEWTKTHGFGNTYTKSFKVIEKLTDKEGKFSIEGISDRGVNPPDMTIYKKGYVAWNNEYIFPGYKHRSDFKWKDGSVYRLERFKSEFSYIEHTSFINSAIHASIGNKKLTEDSYRWEEIEASRERDRQAYK